MFSFQPIAFPVWVWISALSHPKETFLPLTEVLALAKVQQTVLRFTFSSSVRGAKKTFPEIFFLLLPSLFVVPANEWPTWRVSIRTFHTMSFFFFLCCAFVAHVKNTKHYESPPGLSNSFHTTPFCRFITFSAATFWGVAVMSGARAALTWCCCAVRFTPHAAEEENFMVLLQPQIKALSSLRE